MTNRTPFPLWSPGRWPTREVVGESYRLDGIRSLFPARTLTGGADIDTMARLVPEPQNAHDPHAVAVVVQGVLVGYLARDEAAKYQAVLLDMNRAGFDPVVPCTIHGYEYEEVDYDRRGRPVTSMTFEAQARILLDEWYRCRPVNGAPPNHALLPVGSALQVQKEENHQDVLQRYLNANGECWAYATLHVIDGGTPRAPKEVVEIRIDGSRAGQLTPASSTYYIPTVRALSAVGKTTTAQIIVKGNTIQVEVVLHAARAHDLDDAWVRSHTGALHEATPNQQVGKPVRWQFNPAPGWPAAPPDWIPDPTWRPPSDWPAAPPGWRFWIERR